MTMSKGEKAELTIEPEWAYGKKGNIDAKYPFFKETKNCIFVLGCVVLEFIHSPLKEAPPPSFKTLTVTLFMKIVFVYHAI